MNANQALEQWTCHAGDLAFDITAPPAWASEQRKYLSGYLAGRLGDADQGKYRLQISLAEPAHLLRHEAADHEGRLIEHVPGVILRETTHLSGQRTYVIIADDLHREPGSFAVAVAGRSIELRISRDARNPQAHPLRLIREAMLRTYEDTGAVVIHGAGVDVAGRGVLVCGPRFAGKTTTLAALLRATGGAMLSNDRLIVGDGGRMVSVPLPVPVARPTVQAVPELLNALPAATRPQPSLAHLPDAFAATRKAEFTAREFAAAFGTGLAPGSWLHTVIVPRLSESDERPVVRRLTRAEVGQVLNDNCFTPRDEFWLTPWLVPRATPDGQLTEHARAVVARLAAEAQGFEIRCGVRGAFNALTDAVLAVIRRSQ